MIYICAQITGSYLLKRGGNSKIRQKIMKTTVKFNKGNQTVIVTDLEVLEFGASEEICNYLETRIAYSNFCNSQTKSGQARKNERARVRHSMFANFDSEKLDAKILEIKKNIAAAKESKMKKIIVEIEYDGRKSSNLSKIIGGVKMAVFTGGISPQYYGIGLIDFQIK